MLCEPPVALTPITRKKGSKYYFENSTRSVFFPLIGKSEKIINLRNDIDNIGDGLLIFIVGEPGCENKSVAYQVFLNGGCKYSRFLHISPAEENKSLFVDQLIKYVDRVEFGVIFVSEIYSMCEMDLENFYSVVSSEKFMQKLRLRSNLLIVSIFPREGMSLSYIEDSAMLNYILLPPLRMRKSDIRDHIDHVALEFGMTVNISEAALSMLYEYEWPGNVSELHETILNLILNGGSDIRRSDVLSVEKMNKPAMFDVVGGILNQSLSKNKVRNVRVNKAIEYIGDHFLDNITLEELANAASTSPSHLSYLLRKHLNLSFKSILCQVRIRFAQQLIESSPAMTITDVCMQSGFGDLSHFEKTFKRYVKCTPRQYRERYR